MFFENIWESQLIKSVNTETVKKIRFSSANTHPELSKSVDEYELPSLYGGTCSCKATCIYSEKGPWTEVENMIDYKNPGEDSSNNSADFNDPFAGVKA